MSIEEFISEIESSEQPGNSVESSKEVSEKFKESIKKASAKIGKTQKDEQKAKKYDFLLAGILVKIIVDPKYDFVLESLFKTLHNGFSSNFILGILSIININISNKIREIAGVEKIKFNYKEKTLIPFDDNNLNVEVKNRINKWVEDMNLSVSIEYSNIQTQKLIELIKTKNNVLIEYITKVFSFFLKEINIEITNIKSINISEFILKEVENKIKKLEIEEI